MNSSAILTIILMAVATAAARLGGLWLMGRIKMSPFIERWLENLPGSLVLAIVAPTIFAGNPAESFAAIAVILIMIFTKNLLLAMVVGSGVVFLVRSLLNGF